MFEIKLKGGFPAQRKLSISVNDEEVFYPLLRLEEWRPYDSFVLGSGEIVHIEDCENAVFPGQRVNCFVGDSCRFTIERFQSFMKPPTYNCIDRDGECSMMIRSVGGNKWYQYDFLASPDGSLQIPYHRLLFSDSVPFALAASLYLLLDTRVWT
jgi:hypothetical protein